jgi:hypothetical protein
MMGRDGVMTLTPVQIFYTYAAQHNFQMKKAYDDAQISQMSGQISRTGLKYLWLIMDFILTSSIQLSSW